MPDFEDAYDNHGDEPAALPAARMPAPTRGGGSEGPDYAIAGHQASSEGYLQVKGVGDKAAMQVVELDAYNNGGDDLYDAIA